MKCFFLCLIFLLVYTGLLAALTLEQATDKIAVYFSKTDVQHESTSRIFIRVVNAYTGENDNVSQQIEKGLRTSFESSFPTVEVSIGLGGKNSIQVSANHRQRGLTTLLRVTAFNTAKKNIVLGSKVTNFVAGNRGEGKLAVVLDLTSVELSSEQKQAFGNTFRTEIGESDAFEEIDMLEDDEYDLNAVQQQFGCANQVMLDRCARSIGVYLKVDWLVSSSYLKISDHKYMLSGKLMDIVNDSSLATEIIEHDGNLDTLDTVLKKLAARLLANLNTVPVPERIKRPYIPKMITGRSRMPSRAELLAQASENAERKQASVNWHIVALTTAGVASTLAAVSAIEYNELLDEAENAVESGDSKRYDQKVEEANDAKSRYRFFDAVTIAALVWEAYLLFFSDLNIDGSIASVDLKPQIKPEQGGYSAATSLSFRWQW